MLNQFAGVVSRTLFVAAFLLAALAAWEKLLNVFGFRIVFLGDYTPSRLLGLATVVLLFVIALQLRDIKQALHSGP